MLFYIYVSVLSLHVASASRSLNVVQKQSSQESTAKCPNRKCTKQREPLSIFNLLSYSSSRMTPSVLLTAPLVAAGTSTAAPVGSDAAPFCGGTHSAGRLSFAAD